MKATKASNQWLKRQGKAGPGHPQNFPLSICHFPRAECWGRQSINLSVVPSSGNKWKCIGALKADVNACRRCRGESFGPSIRQSFSPPVSQSVNQEMAKYSLLPGKRSPGRRSEVAGRGVDWLRESKATPALPLAYNLLLAGNKLKICLGPCTLALISHFRHCGNWFAALRIRHRYYAYASDCILRCRLAMAVSSPLHGSTKCD